MPCLQFSCCSLMPMTRDHACTDSSAIPQILASYQLKISDLGTTIMHNLPGKWQLVAITPELTILCSYAALTRLTHIWRLFHRHSRAPRSTVLLNMLARKAKGRVPDSVDSSPASLTLRHSISTHHRCIGLACGLTSHKEQSFEFRFLNDLRS